MTRIDKEGDKIVLTVCERTKRGNIEIFHPSEYGLSNLKELEMAVQSEFTKRYPDAKKGIPNHFRREY